MDGSFRRWMRSTYPEWVVLMPATGRKPTPINSGLRAVEHVADQGSFVNLASAAIADI